MNYRILSILTRTPLHVGAGSSVGAIDMPIQRERHTLIPIIPGSGLKGVLRDLWQNESEKAEQERLFGPESNSQEHKAGALLVGEARVLCFPVRSAQGSFAWVSSHLALQRYAREVGRQLQLPVLTEEQCLAGDLVQIKDKDKSAVVLEEYAFKCIGRPDEAALLLEGFLPGDPLMASLPGRLVVVADGIFSHFCATACEVQQRVRIDDKTGTVAQGGLFNQENVPSETVFYAVMGERNAAGELDCLANKLKDQNGILQVGGDETIGLGYCSVMLQGGAQ